LGSPPNRKQHHPTPCDQSRLGGVDRNCEAVVGTAWTDLFELEIRPRSYAGVIWTNERSPPEGAGCRVHPAVIDREVLASVALEKWIRIPSTGPNVVGTSTPQRKQCRRGGPNHGSGDQGGSSNNVVRHDLKLVRRGWYPKGSHSESIAPRDEEGSNCRTPALGPSPTDWWSAPRRSGQRLAVQLERSQSSSQVPLLFCGLVPKSGLVT
jgi:hypothetical protein